MVRGKSYRRLAAKKWQRRRYNKWNVYARFYTEWLNIPRTFGMLRKNHFGCGCPMCKPWKHKLEKKYPFNIYKHPQFYLER